MTKRQQAGDSGAEKDSTAKPAAKRTSSTTTKSSSNTSATNAADCATADKPKKRKTRSSEVIDAEREFAATAIARGDAQYPGPDGKLPRGATHEIIDQPSGERVVRRRRFSAV